MKQKIILICLLFFVSLNFNNVQADDFWDFEDMVLLKDLPKIFTGKKSSRRHKRYYKTWTVAEVTTDKIILQREMKDGKTVEVSIDLSRRPYLNVGDRVRYDKIRNRLGKTLDK